MAAAPFGKRVDAPPWDLAVLRRVDQTSSLVVVSGRSQPYRDTAELTATPGAIRSFPADPMSRALDLVAGDWNGDQLPDALTMEGGATPTLGGWLGAEGGGFAPLPPLELSRCIGSCASLAGRPNSSTWTEMDDWSCSPSVTPSLRNRAWFGLARCPQDPEGRDGVAEGLGPGLRSLHRAQTRPSHCLLYRCFCPRPGGCCPSPEHRRGVSVQPTPLPGEGRIRTPGVRSGRQDAAAGDRVLQKLPLGPGRGLPPQGLRRRRQRRTGAVPAGLRDPVGLGSRVHDAGRRPPEDPGLLRGRPQRARRTPGAEVGSTPHRPRSSPTRRCPSQ
jgi:hypothetical protein